MALWDKFGKKASETTSKALNQARTLSETTKLNALIAEEEKKIKKLYFLIGKTYAENHREDYDNVLTRHFTMLTESEQCINDYRIKIQRLKGIALCGECGAEVMSKASFCSSCGAALPRFVEVEEQENDEIMVCSNCGEEVEEGMRFCTNCGHPIDFKDNDSDDDVIDGDEEIEYKCSQCGAPMDEGDTFCIECGAGL